MTAMSSPNLGGYARALRREIIQRNQRLVEEGSLAATRSYGKEEVVVYRLAQEDMAHGNFFPASYASILKSPDWRKRLTKAHTGRRNLPKHETDQWRELDSCTSSDALLMNIFCHPDSLASGKLQRLMSVDLDVRPSLGVRVAAP